MKYAALTLFFISFLSLHAGGKKASRYVGGKGNLHRAMDHRRSQEHTVGRHRKQTALENPCLDLSLFAFACLCLAVPVMAQTCLIGPRGIQCDRPVYCGGNSSLAECNVGNGSIVYSFGTHTVAYAVRMRCNPQGPKGVYQCAKSANSSLLALPLAGR